MSEAIVTVVISAREGHALAEQSLESVLADDGLPFELIYIDNVCPPAIAARLREQCGRRACVFLRHDAWIAPAAARKLALAHVKTKYVAFVDNDVLVERGCLQRLLACAEETGAGLVCPLYLQAGPGVAPTVHMAGGILEWSDGDRRVLLSERHHLPNARLEEAEGLVRKTVDFTEYHYVLGRMDLLSQPDAISDDILLLHEHIHLGLFTREQGLRIVMEPSARVTYIAFNARRLIDAAFYRRRWDVESCELSLRAFEKRWPAAVSAGVTDPARAYVRLRWQEFELRRAGSQGVDLAKPMAPAELAQTRCALREQAIARGYSGREVRTLEHTCDFATLLFDGLYRPDGRPFLNHVIGTASALVRYELGVAIVQAGLVHAAYTHRPPWIAEEEVQQTLRKVPSVELMVRAQAEARAFLADGDGDLMMRGVAGAATFALLAANDVDMRLSGEYRATGRPPELAPRSLASIAAALALFGIDGLAKTAGPPESGEQGWPLFGAGVRHGSFRLDARNRQLLPI